MMMKSIILTFDFLLKIGDPEKMYHRVWYDVDGVWCDRMWHIFFRETQLKKHQNGNFLNH